MTFYELSKIGAQGMQDGKYLLQICWPIPFADQGGNKDLLTKRNQAHSSETCLVFPIMIITGPCSTSFTSYALYICWRREKKTHRQALKVLNSSCSVSPPPKWGDKVRFIKCARSCWLFKMNWSGKDIFTLTFQIQNLRRKSESNQQVKPWCEK